MNKIDKFIYDNRKFIMICVLVLLAVLFYIGILYVSYYFAISFFYCFHFKKMITFIFAAGSLGPVVWNLLLLTGRLPKKVLIRFRKKKSISKCLLDFLLASICIVVCITAIRYPFSVRLQAKGELIVNKYYPPAVVELGNKISNETEHISDPTDTEKKLPEQGNDIDSQETLALENGLQPFAFDSKFIINDLNKQYFISQDLLEKCLLNLDDELISVEVQQRLNSNIYSLYGTREPCSQDRKYFTLFYDAQKDEDVFLGKIEEAQSIRDRNVAVSDQWFEFLPSSNDLDAFIEKRTNMVQLGYVDFQIFDRLSNDYQRYADEYYKLNRNPDAILYFYCKSIEMDMESLRYATTVGQKMRAICRIKARYSDISSCQIIDSEIRNAAKHLKEAMS